MQGSPSQSGPSLAPSKDGGPCHRDSATPGPPCSDCTLATEPGPDLCGSQERHSDTLDPSGRTLCLNNRPLFPHGSEDWEVQRQFSLPGLPDGWLSHVLIRHQAGALASLPLQTLIRSDTASHFSSHFTLILYSQGNLSSSRVAMGVGGQQGNFEEPNSVDCTLCFPY